MSIKGRIQKSFPYAFGQKRSYPHDRLKPTEKNDDPFYEEGEEKSFLGNMQPVM